MRAEFL